MDHFFFCTEVFWLSQLDFHHGVVFPLTLSPSLSLAVLCGGGIVPIKVLGPEFGFFSSPFSLCFSLVCCETNQKTSRTRFKNQKRGNRKKGNPPSSKTRILNLNWYLRFQFEFYLFFVFRDIVFFSQFIKATYKSNKLETNNK